MVNLLPCIVISCLTYQLPGIFPAHPTCVDSVMETAAFGIGSAHAVKEASFEI